MNILVVGGGGREAALVYKIAQSPRVTKIFCAPGNPGIAKLATLVPIAVDQMAQLLQFAKENQIDLTVIGPEIPLSLGIVDLFQKEGMKIFGPCHRAARLESSKAFSKQFMQRHHIPTPQAEVVTMEEAMDKIMSAEMPIVLKVDGLAAGKGVVIAQNIKEASAGLDYFRSIGKGKEKILIEQYLKGIEATFLVVIDSKTAVPLSSAKDHKRLLDDDLGPNTGGMGAISPAPAMTSALCEQVMTRIIDPTLKGLAEEGIVYQGVLYVGLMLTEEGPYVLEFNARLGDPETQAVLPRLKTDWIDLMESVLEHRLDQLQLQWRDEVAVSVVMASSGYPGDHQSGEEIFGLDQINDPDLMLFHAGTKNMGNRLLTQGGRVLSITALGKDRHEARDRVYRAVGQVSFRGMQYRKDIGK